MEAMPLNQLIDQYPNQLLCSLLLALLTLLGASLHLYQSRLHLDEQLALAGDNLARQAAQRLADPTLIEDPVSQQILLRELVQTAPLVVGAAVHDVEGQVRVQSGQIRHLDGTRRYSAPILLQQHQAGTLWLTLASPTRNSRQLAFFWIWPLTGGLLMLAPWLLLLYRRPGSPEQQRPEEFSLPELPEAPPGPGAAVRLSLHLCNLGKVYSQLNSAGFNQLMNTFDEQLRKVLNLYGGQRQLLWGQVLIVDFQGEEAADCSFRAICASQLLFNLHAQLSPRLQLAATVQGLPAPDTSAGVEQEFIAQYSERRLPEPGEILIAARLADARLRQYVQTEEHTGLVLAIQPPYCDMLQKQEQRLREI